MDLSVCFQVIFYCETPARGMGARSQNEDPEHGAETERGDIFIAKAALPD